MSIRTSFILTLFFSLAVMAGIVSYAARMQAVKEADAVFTQTATAQLDRVEDIIATYFRAAELAAKNLAALPETVNAALARSGVSENDARATPADSALLARLAAMRAVIPGVETAFCGYKNGSFLVSPAEAAPEGDDPRTRSWYSDTAWGSAETSITDASISESSKSLVATVAARINDGNGETLGVAGLDISLAPLTDTLRDLRIGRTGYLVLFDANGRVLLDPMAQENLMLAAGETGDAALAALVGGPSGMQSVKRGGTDMAVFSRTFAFSRWKAALVMEKTEQVLPGQSAARITMLVAAVLCLTLAAFGAIFAILSTRPLQALIRQSGALADGNVDALAGIPGRGPDITELHGNLGRLTGRVMLLVQAEKEKSDEIEVQNRKAAVLQTKADLADQSVRDAFLAVCRKTAHAISPLAADIAGAVARLGDQLAAAQESAQTRLHAAEEARETVTAIQGDASTHARQAVEMEKNADAAAMAAKNSATLAHDMVRALETAGEALAALPGSLDPLKAGVADLGRATNDVRDLAEQANLLGLNIAIEAASLGEDGKEVSRAAETMRALAERAMAATGSLDNVIAALDNGQAAHALAVAKSAATAKRAVSVAEKVKTAFNAIAAATATTAEQVRVLATALEGAALHGQSGVENAVALTGLSGEAEDALQALAATATELAALSSRLALTSGELETSSDDDTLCLVSRAAFSAPQKPLD
ncbi:methyl-accepting chemotaxis protein [Desulfovibrio sp. OttesenSCG-928-O18]|nr:methyl-accepting chemotaxis protein [Desulfovibrio sp. OttesenSCG-928-O18]